jgi:TolB-like protein/Tfp pilus assembly protein PilF
MKIVHRDVKPDNIMINKDGVVKIVDFGLAKLSGQTVLTKEGTMMGTLSHMSPEQAQGSSVDHRTDIWSLGVIIYEMISGRKPFQGDYDQAVVYSIINEQPEPLARFKANIPVNLQNIVDRTLTKDAHTRYQSTADLAADLKRTQDKLSDSDNGHPRKKRLSKSLVISTVPALILMFAIYIILFNHRVDPDQSRKNNALLMNPSQWDNSIAVLPFKNISSDAEQEYFCEGMTEQIITNLSRLQNLKVIARTSVMKFKTTQKTVPEIAAELGVAHILEGSIRKYGKKIRVTAQLIQANGGHHLWANDYDREVRDVFAVQDDVSQAIATALLENLTFKASEQIKTKGTDIIEAYEYYLKGYYFHNRHYFIKGTMEYFYKSEIMFEKAIELDKNYALAYAGLADLYNSFYHSSTKDDEKTKYMNIQQTLIKKAFKIDPGSAGVNRVKGWVHAAIGEKDQAYKHFKQALSINPNQSNNIFAMGNFLGRQGFIHHAIRYITKSIEMDPLDPVNHWMRAIFHRRLGNMEYSIADYRSALEIEPDHVHALNGIAKSLMIQKRYQEAEDHLVKSENIKPDYGDTKRSRAFFLAALGRENEAFEMLERFGYTSNYDKIVIYCLSGLKEEALRLIDKKPWTNYTEMMHHPFFTILRDTEEYKLIIGKAKIIYEENLIKYAEVL